MEVNELNLSPNTACTICSANYFAYALTLAKSFRSVHPEASFVILIVDAPNMAIDARARAEGISLLYVEQLGLPRLREMAFKFSVVEFNTNVKAAFLRILLAQGAQRALYIDPDIFLFQRLDEVYKYLETANVAVTPHSLSPIGGVERPWDLDFLATGTFNLGFAGVSNTSQGLAFLDWWAARCEQLGYSDTRAGLFTDQKFVDLAPCYFEGVHVLRNRGYNMAPWNLHERHLTESTEGLRVNGEELLVFYHFSGIDIEGALEISKYMRKHTLETHPELKPLYAMYREQVLANGHREFKQIRYAFSKYSNGEPITLLARRAFSIYEEEFAGQDPFNAQGRFIEFARRYKMISASDSAARFNALNTPGSDRRVQWINRALRWLLKLIGADKYTMLMKYLSYVSMLRHHRDVLDWKIERSAE